LSEKCLTWDVGFTPHPFFISEFGLRDLETKPTFNKSS
jgi:hypothetical protein